VQYASRLPQPSRTLVVPLLAAALGAGVATATFALVNIEDDATVSLPTVQTAQPSTAVAGERNDGGPSEGAAQQIMRPAAVQPASRADALAERMPHSVAAANAATELRGSKAAATVAPRYDGGPNEGSSADAMSDTQPPKGTAPSSEPRYDGGPNEGSSAGAIAGP
jgi:hypothetical protein